MDGPAIITQVANPKDDEARAAAGDKGLGAALPFGVFFLALLAVLRRLLLLALDSENHSWPGWVEHKD